MALSFMITLLLSLPFFLVTLLRRRPKPNLPPGPRPLPIIGNLHQMSALLFRTFYELSKQHGPLLHLRLGRVPYLVISSPSLAEQVLKAHDLAFCYRAPLVSLCEYSFNGCDMVAAPYGNHWRNLRKVFSLELVGAKNLPSFRRVREEEVMQMIRFIAARTDSSSAVNVTELLFRLTSGIINRVAFGHREQYGNYGEKSRLQRMLEELHAIMGSFWAEDFFPGFGWVNVLRGLRRRLRRNAKEFDEFFQDVIDQHLNSGDKKEDSEEDIVDVLIRLWKEGEKGITMDHIKGSLSNILVGGTDTTATTLIWSMTELIRNPSMMKKAQCEVREAIGSKGKVEESDLARFDYLKAVIKESFRLHPPVPLLVPRECIQQVVVDGYNVSSNTVVFVNVWAIGRDENYWENALDYYPERFLGSSIYYKGNNFQFLPFGAGRRMCPGMNFGVTTVELVLANLLYAFDWELPPGVNGEDIDMVEAPGIAANKKATLYLVAKSKP